MKAPSSKPIKIYLVAGENVGKAGEIQYLHENWPEYTTEDPKLWHFNPVAKPPSTILGETYDRYGIELVPAWRSPSGSRTM